jgi:hypothetical protein
MPRPATSRSGRPCLLPSRSLIESLYT